MSWVPSNWLWFVWAAMAALALVGFVHIRKRLRRAEKSEDVGDEEAQKRHEAEHRKKRSRGVE